MKRNRLQYIVLTIGTIVFITMLYILVQGEKGKITIPLIERAEEYNQITTEIATVYSKPDNTSTILATLSSNTKVKTTSETKYYFRVQIIDGYTNLSDGYISKRQLKRLN